MTAVDRLCYGTIAGEGLSSSRLARPARRAPMVRIELSAQQAQELSAILEDYLSDLRMEIVDTDSQDFRESLKRRKELVSLVVDQLKASGS
jgi:glycine cleavage system regulatory protein